MNFQQADFAMVYLNSSGEDFYLHRDSKWFHNSGHISNIITTRSILLKVHLLNKGTLVLK